MKELIRKTVIGSFPRLDDSPEASIRKVIDLQLKHGLDIVADGEQRCGMIDYFDQIPGLSRIDGRLQVTGRIHPPSQIEKLHKLRDFTVARRYLDEKGLEHVGLKVAVTGPTTLGLTCASAGLSAYKSVADIELYRDLAVALEPLIDELLRVGAVVQIDEPGISAGFVDPAQATGLINEIVADLKHHQKGRGRLSVHVCGDLTRIGRLFSSLTELNVDILSFAFKGRVEERNIRLLSDRAFIDSEKKLGLGCISVASTNLESVDSVREVAEFLNDCIRKIGANRIAYVHPNCGLKNTPLDVAEEILRRMGMAIEQVQNPM